MLQVIPSLADTQISNSIVYKEEIMFGFFGGDDVIQVLVNQLSSEIESIFTCF